MVGMGGIGTGCWDDECFEETGTFVVVIGWGMMVENRSDLESA